MLSDGVSPNSWLDIDEDGIDREKHPPDSGAMKL